MPVEHHILDSNTSSATSQNATLFQFLSFISRIIFRVGPVGLDCLTTVQMCGQNTFCFESLTKTNVIIIIVARV